MRRRSTKSSLFEFIFKAKRASAKTFYSEVLEKTKLAFESAPDIVYRKVNIIRKTDACFIYLQDIIDVDILQRDFIMPIISGKYSDEPEGGPLKNVPVSNLKVNTDIDSIVEDIVKGNAVFISENMDYSLSYFVRRQIERNIEEPATEKNLKSSHEGFVESIHTNIGIVRMKISNSNLKFKQLTVGDISNQAVYVAYLKGVANENSLTELIRRLELIKTDNVSTIGYIESRVSQFPNSPFLQSQATERPDKVVAALIEGRLAVLLDGVPNVMIVPISFSSLFQTVDDYGTKWLSSYLLRLLRYVSLLITVLLPSVYVMLTSFHYYMIPVSLITTLADSRAKVPFPPIIEILIMETAIEMLREATIRLPTYIGMTIGVVGGIVIGQAAVNAGIISNLLLIIVGLTAICSSTFPSTDHALSIRYIRFPVLIFTAAFGIIGTAVCIMLIFAHLVTLDSLGEPYLKPLDVPKLKTIKQSVTRLRLRLFRSPQN